MRTALEAAFWAAVEAAHPQKVLASALPKRPAGKAYVFAAGKAAVPMAEEVERQWGGDLEGVVVAPHGGEASLSALTLATASHPYPDAAGARSASALFDKMSAVPAEADVLFLLSGGASSLLLATADGPAPDALQAATKALLNGGADIYALNTVRRMLSPLLGGGLAQACPGRIKTLAISDVVGDNPVAIGSGPTVPNPTGKAEALDLLRQYGGLTPEIEAWIEQQPDPVAFEPDYQIIASGPLLSVFESNDLICLSSDLATTRRK